jgi:hypothetical protein
MGKLPESESAPLEEHLLICEECQGRLKATYSYIAAMREALRDQRDG